MMVKELIEIINDFGVNVIFDNSQEVASKIIRGGFPLYFTPVDGKEKLKYEKISNKAKFISTTPTIHIIDLSIDNFIDMFKCDVSGIYEYTKNLIKPYCTNEIPEDIVYVIFSFLHEVGHWKQFMDMDKKVELFVNKDLKLSKDNFEKYQEFQRKRSERIKKGSDCIMTYNEKKLVNQYMNEYRKIPKEKEADEFALENLDKTINKYINKTK